MKHKHLLVATVIMTVTMVGITLAWIFGRETGFEEAFRLMTGSSEVRLTRKQYKQQLVE